MSDQCKNCEARDDYKVCVNTECFHHENWIAEQRIKKMKQMNEDIKFLLSFVPKWALIVPKGLDPTFYGTLTYEGDLEVQGKVLDITNKAGCSYS